MPDAAAGVNAFIVTSPAYGEDQTIPRRFTCDGANLSPALAWHGAPEGTEGFALVMDDPDAPRGTFTHWVLFDLPAALDGLAEGDRATGIGGRNDFGTTGYGGPCPPRGHGPHRYQATLYALSVASLGLRAGAGRDRVAAAMAGHVLGEACLTGRYER